MLTAIDFLSKDFTYQVVGAIAAAIVLGIASGFWQRWQYHLDSRKIVDFLKNSRTAGQYTFRSTQAIASATNLTDRRVEQVCSAHPEIVRNGAELQTWKLST